MEVFTVFKSIASLFLIMIVGVVGRKRNIITAEINRGMIDILLQILLPFMILSSFSFSYDDRIKANVVKSFYLSIIVYLLLIVISLILTKPVKGEKRTILHFANVFTNTGYLGFPVLNVIYGPEGVIYGSIFNMFFALFLWTYGIIIFKGKMTKEELRRELFKVMISPSVVAVYIGIVMMIFNLSFPEVVADSINTVGSMNGPMSMIIVGAIFANINIKNHLKDWTLYYGILMKMVLIPGILCLFTYFTGDRSIVTNSIIILASMPAAAMTPILAENFDLQKDYAAVIMVVTTLLSLITIPILLRILM
ncbi:MAG: AEC family transporter [Tissierellia bacterium]|nr:AEC family transporter [Tissierellia bacterium]